jgi:acyl-CoA reductase-like NAD-dependent aldehyde dehydrogenase
MIPSHTDIPASLARLDPVARARVLEAPRSARLVRLADELRENADDTLAALARETGLPLADAAAFDLEELGTLPAQLVHAGLSRADPTPVRRRGLRRSRV